MPAHGPQPGDLVGGAYRLERLIGTGGMGAVWSAAFEGNREEKVAIKFLHAQMANDPLIVQRFLLEARAGMEIRHPNVVRLLASGWLEADEEIEREAMPWIAMELLSGKTLSEVLRLRPRLEAVDALAIVCDVVAGAAAAHTAKIVHRDLKPANVFLKRETETRIVPKVLDFGISKFVDPNLDGGLTTTGAIVGSAMYMSPEQAMGGYQVDLRSDVWSLGILLYRVLTGESPLPMTHQEIMVDLATPHELSLGSLRNTRIPEGAAAVIRRCLRKKREERYDSAVALEAELRLVLDDVIAKANRKPNLIALLSPPTSDATLIAAPMVHDEGESTTAAVTAPTGLIGSTVAMTSDAAHATATIAMVSSPPSSTAAPTPRPSSAFTETTVRRPPVAIDDRRYQKPTIIAVAVTALLLIVSLGAWEIFREKPHPISVTAPPPPTSTSTATSDTPPSPDEPASSSSSSSSSTPLTSVTRSHPPKPPKIIPHPPFATTNTTTAPTTKPSVTSTAEPWRRPGF